MSGREGWGMDSVRSVTFIWNIFSTFVYGLLKEIRDWFIRTLRNISIVIIVSDISIRTSLVLPDYLSFSR
jgi:hypothetical protein